MAAGWTVRGLSAPVLLGSGTHPTSYTMGTEYFPGVKWPWFGFENPTTSNTEVKERIQLNLYSKSGPSWPVIGWNLNTRGVTSNSIAHCTLTAYCLTVGSKAIPGIPFCHESSSVLSRLLLYIGYGPTAVHYSHIVHDFRMSDVFVSI